MLGENSAPEANANVSSLLRLHRQSEVDEVVNAAVLLKVRKEARNGAFVGKAVSPEPPEDEAKKLADTLYEHNVRKLWQIPFLKPDMLLDLGFGSELAHLLRSVADAFANVEEPRRSKTTQDGAWESNEADPKSTDKTGPRNPADIIKILDELRRKRRVHKVTRRMQNFLKIISIILIVGGIILAILSSLAFRRNISREALFGIVLGALIFITNAIAYYGAQRVYQDVMQETYMWKDAKYRLALTSVVVPAGIQKVTESSDGMETVGQHVIQAAAYANSFALIITCILASFTLPSSAFNSSGASQALLHAATYTGLALLPLQIVSLIASTIIVSVYEMMQSLAEVIAMIASAVAGAQAVASIWVVNRVLETSRVVNTIPIWIPMMVFCCDITLILSFIFAFRAVWIESLRRLRVARILVLIIVFPMCIFQLVTIMRIDLASLVQNNCKLIMSSISEEFFSNSLGCTKYIGQGQIPTALNSYYITEGPGETVYCGEGSSNKARGAFVWERNPVLAWDGDYTNYYGCLNHDCCSGLSTFISQLNILLLSAAATLLTVCIVLATALSFIINHVAENADLAIIELFEEQTEAMVEFNKQQRRKDNIKKNEKHRKSKRHPSLRHTHTPYLLYVFVVLILLVIVGVVVTGYSSVAKVVNYDSIMNFDMSLPDTCPANASSEEECLASTFCAQVSKDCCINNQQDGPETGVDCGETCGVLCNDGDTCDTDNDCKNCCSQTTGRCEICDEVESTSCSNGIQDDNETCTDGGGVCVEISCSGEDTSPTSTPCRYQGEECAIVGDRCSLNEGCTRDADCEDGLICANGLCVSATSSSDISLQVTSFNQTAYYEELLSDMEYALGIGEVCTSNASCTTLNCAAPACYTSNLGPESSHGKPCVFPFSYNGSLYSSCLKGADIPPANWTQYSSTSTTASVQNSYWCATSFIYNPDNNPGAWGFCSCNSTTSTENSTRICTSYRLDKLSDESYLKDKCETGCGSACSLLGYSLCGSGENCELDRDCESNYCYEGVCVSCYDNITNGDETDVDCGGSECSLCDDSKICTSNSDCDSGLCFENKCISCTDNFQNGNETCTDGGGTFCRRLNFLCGPGEGCKTASDCQKQLGYDATCNLNTSLCEGPQDLKKTGSETDIDCGGGQSAPACAVNKTCESSADCLTTICSRNTKTCDISSDTMDDECESISSETCFEIMSSSQCFKWNIFCKRGYFVGIGNGPFCESGLEINGTCADQSDYDYVATTSAPTTSSDGSLIDECFTSLSENGVCGSPCRRLCPVNHSCTSNDDCQTGLCDGNICAVLGKSRFLNCITPNQIQDAWESDTDCGGQCSLFGVACANGQTCTQHRDCESSLCVDSICVSCASSSDSTVDESTICGGLYCEPCELGMSCASGIDCSGYPYSADCIDGICQSPLCDDLLDSDDSISDVCTGSIILSVDANATAIDYTGRCTALGSASPIIKPESRGSKQCPAPSTCSNVTVEMSVPVWSNVTFVDDSSSINILTDVENQLKSYTIIGSLEVMRSALASAKICIPGPNRPAETTLRVTSTLTSVAEPCQRKALSGSTYKTALINLADSPFYNILGKVTLDNKKANNIPAEVDVMNFCFQQSDCNSSEVGSVLNLKVQYGDLRMITPLSMSLAQNVTVRLRFPGYNYSSGMTLGSDQTVDFGNINLQSLTPSPTQSPTLSPSVAPTDTPTPSPTQSPTLSPSVAPTDTPTQSPTQSPTLSPSVAPTDRPTQSPTQSPTLSPSVAPTDTPTQSPTQSPTLSPSVAPTDTPTQSPTQSPTLSPSVAPTDTPTQSPTQSPTLSPSVAPTNTPTQSPTQSPTLSPSVAPTDTPTQSPTQSPTLSPSVAPTDTPTHGPTAEPTSSPTSATAVFAVRESFCGGVAKSNSSELLNSTITITSETSQSICNIVSVTTTCALPASTGSFSVNVSGSSIESVTTTITCDAEGVCECGDYSLCSESEGQSSLLTFWTRSKLEEGAMRACLTWSVDEVDLDLEVKFHTNDTLKDCRVFNQTPRCGDVVFKQYRDNNQDGAEGILLNNIYEVVYTFSVRNVNWPTSNFPTELTGAQLTIDGNGVSNYSVGLRTYNDMDAYQTWPGSWIGGEFRNSSQFARMACISGTSNPIQVANAMMYSTNSPGLMSVCPASDAGLSIRCGGQTQLVSNPTYATTSTPRPTPKPTVSPTPRPTGPFAAFSVTAPTRVPTKRPTEYPTSSPTLQQVYLVGKTDAEADSFQNFASNESQYKSSATMLSAIPRTKVHVTNENGTCYGEADYEEASRTCFDEGRMLCSASDLELLSIEDVLDASMCAANEESGWTFCDNESGNCCAANDSRNQSSIWPVCNYGGCQANASYSGERCWHDGNKPKSCKDSWSSLLSDSSKFVNTLEHCDLCAEDEDCRLYVLVGFPNVDEPIYDFEASCKNETNSTDCIPANKIAGQCLNTRENGEYTCGMGSEFITEEDGYCFTSEFSGLLNNTCSCSSALGLKETTCLGPNETSRVFCCSVEDSVWPRDAPTMYLEMEGGDSSAVEFLTLFNISFYSEDNPESSTLIILPNTSDLVNIGLLQGSGTLDTSARCAKEASVDVVELSSTYLQSDEGYYLMPAPVPSTPGSYYACVFVETGTSQTSCPLEPVCTLSDDSSAIISSCFPFRVSCPQGWTGDSCSTCDSLDSDNDTVLDCYDVCPNDPTITSESDFTSDEDWCGNATRIQAEQSEGRRLSASARSSNTDTDLSNKTTTFSGLECQAWNKQIPHAHAYNTYQTNKGFCNTTDTDDPGLPCGFPYVNNYMSLADGSTQSELLNKRFCPPIGYHELNVSTAMKGTECDILVNVAAPGLGRHNKCRNPNNDPNGAWCFTTNPNVRWEYCEEVVVATDDDNDDDNADSPSFLLGGENSGVFLFNTSSNSTTLVIEPDKFSVVSVSKADSLDLPSYVYLGCASGDASTFTTETRQKNMTDPTPAKCAAYCKTLGSKYKYFNLFKIQTHICECLLTLPATDSIIHYESDQDGSSCWTSSSGIACDTDVCIKMPAYYSNMLPVCNAKGIVSTCICRCTSYCSDGSPCGGGSKAARALYSIDSDHLAWPSAYVADAASNRVVAFDEEWRLRSWFHLSSVELSQPGAVCFISDGRIAVVDASTGDIIIFTTERIVEFIIPNLASSTTSTSDYYDVRLSADELRLYALYPSDELVVCGISNTDDNCTRYDLQYPSILQSESTSSGAKDLARLSAAASNIIFIVDPVGGFYGYRFKDENFLSILSNGTAVSSSSSNEVDRPAVLKVAISSNDDIYLEYESQIVALNSTSVWDLPSSDDEFSIFLVYE